MKRAVLAAAAALAVAAPAASAPPHAFVALPSPLAQLSPSPPLSGGATASSEGLRHRVAATATVDVAVDRRGAPFRVQATQRLDVRVKGDYFFTIGAPLTAVEAAPGSASTPGFRASAIVWAGFNPGRRTLAARATLATSAVTPLLPLRLRIGAGTVTLTNATGADAGSFTADAPVEPLRRYFAQVRRDIARGVIPTSGGATVTSKTVPTTVHVVVPLHVVGTIGARRVDTVVEDRAVMIRAAGRVRLAVTPELPNGLLHAPAATLSGRQLFTHVARTMLTLARQRQYLTFLGNPDPSGRSRTTYVYRSATRPAPATPAVVQRTERDWPLTLATLAAIAIAVGGIAYAWSRS